MNRAQRTLAAGLFVVAWGTNVSTPLILRYQDRLGLTDTGAVGIFTIYVGGILLALLFAGQLSDRVGRRPLVVPFTALSAIASLILIPGRDSLLLLFTGRLLLGAVSGAVLSVGTAWLVELSDGPVDDARRVRLASLTTTMVYIGFGFGPISSAVYEAVGPAPLVVPYLVHAGTTTAVLVLMLGLRETKPPDPAIPLRPRLGVPAHARADFFRVLAPASIWVFGFPSTSFALFPVILRDAIGGLDVLIAGLTGMVTAVAALLSRPIISRAGSTRDALRSALWMGSGGYVLGSTAFLTDWWWIVPAAAILLGAASGTILTAGLALTDAIADAANRGSLSATFYLGAYCGMAMPVIITGMAAVVSLPAALGIVTAASTAVAALVTVRLRTPLRPGRPGRAERAPLP